LTHTDSFLNAYKTFCKSLAFLMSPPFAPTFGGHAREPSLLDPRNSLNGLLEVLLRSTNVDQRGIKGVMPHQLSNSMQWDGCCHAIAKPMTQIMGMDIRKLCLSGVLLDQISHSSFSQSSLCLCRTKERSASTRLGSLQDRIC